MKQIVFLHIPKAAGSSLVIHLQSKLRRRGIPLLRRLRMFRPIVVTGLHDHTIVGMKREQMMRRAQQASLVHGHFFWNSYAEMAPRASDVLITVLRDPVVRLKSNFRFCKSLGSDHAFLKNICPDIESMTFSEFLNCETKEMRRNLDNGMTRCLGGGYDNDPQSTDQWESLLEQAKANLAKFTEVGFVECFSASMRRINRACQLANIEVDSLNVTPNSHRRAADDLDDTHSSSSAAEILESRICYDRELYDHAKELYWPE